MPKAVLCATHSELERVDTIHLKMSNIDSSESLQEGLQVLAEEESSTLIFTERLLEEQMTERELIDYINLLSSLYPKKVRFIYLKYRRSPDSIVDAMYEIDNWDIYYNTTLEHMSDSEVINLIENRKMPNTDYKKRSTMEDLIKEGMHIKDMLLKIISGSTGVEENLDFHRAVTRNLSGIKNMVLTLEMVGKDLKTEQDKVGLLDTKLMKLNQSLVKISKENNDLSDKLNESNKNNSRIFRELIKIQTAYNSIIDDLKDLVFVERMNVLNYRTKVVEPTMTRAPVILYFKQVSHLNFFTRYISNLTKIMNESLGETKLYVIESESNLLSIPRYTKKGFHYVTNGTSFTSVILGNLFTCGIDSKLLDFLIDNSMSLDYLIIVDKTGVDFDILGGSSVLKVVTANRVSDVKELNLEQLLHITNSKESDMFLGDISKYEDFMKSESKELSLVGASNITKILIKAIKDFSEVRNRIPESQTNQEDATV